VNRKRIDESAHATVETLLDGWAEWGLPLSDRPSLLAPVSGGRTNRNFCLSAPGMESDLLFRLNHPDPARLGIDRALERQILSVTANAGIGRPCCYWDPANQFVLFPFLKGRDWTSADFERREQRDRLWPMIERLGEITLDRPRRRYTDYLRHYWGLLTETGSVDPGLAARWREFVPELEAFDQAPWSAGLVHHDIIPANVLDTGERLYLIDWEYAALGHRDIDVWSVDPARVREPFIPKMMGWINELWERLI